MICSKAEKSKRKIRFTKGLNFGKALKLASETFKGQDESIDRIINLLHPLDTGKIEIIATVYAVWNNLHLMHAWFTDENIITEARNNWAKKSRNIPGLNFNSQSTG